MIATPCMSSAPPHKPVVVVDCGAIAPTLIESELFGHEKGAFTGAHTRKPGRLAQAEGATVFLDEIGDLPLDLQSKLLRFVQEKQFTPVGSVVARTVDVRIIAATNVDLRARVAEGKFREASSTVSTSFTARPAPAGAQGRHPASGHDLPAAVRGPVQPAAHHFTVTRGGEGARGLPVAGNVRECRTSS